MGDSEQRSSDSDLFMLLVVIAAIGAITVIAIPNRIGGSHSSPANACINNLRQIDGAKNEWALEHNQTNLDTVVTEVDIKPYIKLNSKSQIPGCPLRGKYTIGKLGDPPMCSFSNAIPPH